MRNVTNDLSEHALARPHSPAIILADRTISYAELDDAVWRTVRWLHEAGIRPGAIVGLIMADQISLLLAMIGLMRLGATAFPLSPNAPLLQQEELLREAGADAVLSDAAALPITACRLVPFSEGRACAIQRAEMEAFGSTSAPCLLIAGSGTTGRPRLIPSSHKIMRERFNIFKNIYDVRFPERFMLLAAASFNSCNNRALYVLSSGATVVLWNQKSCIIESVACFSPNILHISAFHAEKIIIEAKKNRSADLSSVRLMSIGDSTISENLRGRLLDNLNVRLQINYGSNETSTIAFATPEDLAAAPGSVGRPPPGVLVEIVDESGTPLGAGQVGQVRVRSPAQIAGYLRSGDSDRFRDGWFYPGDLAKWSADGQIFHCGRADQMMIMNGINIYPAEIERIIEQHPAVHDVVAFPLKHAIAQEIPACAVVLKPGAQASQTELDAFARQRLGARTPRATAILDAIPRNEQGKPQRAELLRLVEAALARRIGPSAAPQATPSADRRGGARAADVPLRQPARPLQLNFQPPRVLQASAVDTWLSILNPELGAAASLSGAAGATTQEARVAEWLGKAMLLARELLQVAAIPVFDAPKVLACRPKPDGRAEWHAVISMPAVDHVPAQVYEIALGAASRATAWMMTQAPTAASREMLFAKLKQEAIEPIKQRASGGKSTMPLLRAAHARGIPFRSLGGGIYQLGWGAKGRLTDRSTNDRDAAIGLKLAQSKPLSAQALRLAGLPAPIHRVVTSAADARAAADRLGWPVVVKPADLDRGEGVSVDVDATRLDAAFEEAHRLSRTKQVIVERQVEGVCHRLFLASGRLLYAVKRLPIGVHGDGRRSVEALVSAELAAQALLPPWRRSELRPIDDLARAAISAAGLVESSVPEAGRFVPLRRIESTAWGGVDEEVTDKVHPENLRVALAAAELLGLDVAGVDIISPDISEPWHRNGAIINEVNFAPLLGGGEISRRYVGTYLARLLEGDGRIPVEAFLGGEAAWLAALDRRKALGGDGAGIFVTSAERTLDGNGQEIAMPFKSLHRRTRALLLSRRVHALLLVVQDNEFLHAGLPVESIDSLVDAGGALRQHRNSALTVSPEQDKRLRKLLSDRLPAKGA